LVQDLQRSNCVEAVWFSHVHDLWDSS